MKDNVTENNARDYLAERYPGHLQVDIAGGSAEAQARAKGSTTATCPISSPISA